MSALDTLRRNADATPCRPERVLSTTLVIALVTALSTTLVTAPSTTLVTVVIAALIAALIALGGGFREERRREGLRGTHPQGRLASMPDGSDAGHARTTTLLTLPNVITFARLCMVPMAVWFVLEHRLIVAFFLFLAAGLSDA